jgi:hypothetical protein
LAARRLISTCSVRPILRLLVTNQMQSGQREAGVQ